MMIIFRGYRSRRRREEDGGLRVRNNFSFICYNYMYLLLVKEMWILDVEYICLVFVFFLQRQLFFKEKLVVEIQFDLEINLFFLLLFGFVLVVCIYLVYLFIEFKFIGRYIVYIVMIIFISIVNILDYIVNLKYIILYGKLQIYC